MGIKHKEQKEKSSVSSVEANLCSEIFLSEEPTPCILPSPDPCIELKLSLRQARSVASALDLFVHLGIGNMQFLKNFIDDGTIKKRVETNGLAEPLNFDETEEIVQKLKEITALLGHSDTSHFGIGNNSVSNSAKDCWEIKQVVSAAITSTKTNSETKVQTELITKFTTEPTPKANIVW
ncbi:hypothetical protein QTV49_001736 [Vibrio vulnificus]|nr:hypothetical protein [Vibrio vulnificus]